MRIELVSVSTDGTQGNEMAGRFAGPALSGDGQVVAFDSSATTLVPSDTNHLEDVFVHDRATGTTERVSVSTSGQQGNDVSTRPAIDGSGNLVLFDSSASNLVAGDSNRLMDVFVRDRAAGTTAAVSVTSSGVTGDAGSNSPSISTDGRFVAFISLASNLVPHDRNHVEDAFVRDLVTGTTERVSLSSTGEPGNSSTTLANISADGRWVVFSSFASNLVPGDTNDQFDVFIHDRVTGLTELVSTGFDGSESNGISAAASVSADGRFVAFWSDATNMVADDTNDRRDVFVRDRLTGTTERVSVDSNEQQADGTNEEPGVRGFLASGPDITPDGRYVAFFSSATNLVAGDTNTCPLFFEDTGRCPDVFVRDRLAGTTVRVDVAGDGTQSNDRSADPSISDDGLTVAFWSASWNLVDNDFNVCALFSESPGNCPDIFVHERSATPVADLTTTSADSADPVAVGELLRYGVRVTNVGPQPATRVTLEDTLPAGVDFVAAESTVGSCSARGGRVRCHLGQLAPGVTVLVKIDVRPTSAGPIQNRATASAVQPDPVPADNTTVEGTVVVS